MLCRTLSYGLAQHPELLLDMKRNSKEKSLSREAVLQSHLVIYGEQSI